MGKKKKKENKSNKAPANLQNKHTASGQYDRLLSIIGKGALFILTGGALFSSLFRHHKIISSFATLILVVGSYYLVLDVYNDAFVGDEISEARHKAITEVTKEIIAIKNKEQKKLQGMSEALGLEGDRQLSPDNLVFGYKEVCPNGVPNCQPNNWCTSCDSSCGAYCQNLNGVSCGPYDCISCKDGYRLEEFYNDGTGPCIKEDASPESTIIDSEPERSPTI